MNLAEFKVKYKAPNSPSAHINGCIASLTDFFEASHSGIDSDREVWLEELKEWAKDLKDLLKD